MRRAVSEPSNLILTRREALRLSGCGIGAGCLGGCLATNPATGRISYTGLQSIEDDIAIGAREHPKLVREFGGEYREAGIDTYITQLGKRAAAHAEFQQFQYRFTVVNSPIVNAFALPGGYVYISRGLIALASDEAELMGVLSHEVGHVNARHTAERIASSQLAQIGLLGLAIGTGERAWTQLGNSVAGLVLRQYSQSQEHEADTLGVRYMSLAGYDPKGMASFLTALRAHSMIEAQKNGLPPGKVDERNIMATHPRTLDRVERAAADARRAVKPGTKVGRDAYLDRVDGLLYGDDPRQGLVRDGAFQHPDLRISYSIPSGYNVANGANAVIATAPNGQARMVFDTARAAPGTTMLHYLTRIWAKDLRLSNVDRYRINGMEAALGGARIKTRNGAVDMTGIAYRGPGSTIYRLFLQSAPRETARAIRLFRQSADSFRRLSQAEAAAILPYRMTVKPIGPGDTVRSLSQHFPDSRFREDEFRLINGLNRGEQLPKTGRIKTVGEAGQSV